MTERTKRALDALEEAREALYELRIGDFVPRREASTEERKTASRLTESAFAIVDVLSTMLDDGRRLWVVEKPTEAVESEVRGKPATLHPEPKRGQVWRRDAESPAAGPEICVTLVTEKDVVAEIGDGSKRSSAITLSIDELYANYTFDRYAPKAGSGAAALLFEEKE